MRIAVVSDIHGNRRAFEAVLADLRELAPDLIVHGGDLAFGGAHPADIVNQVRDLGWGGVRGNTDEVFWVTEPLTKMAADPKLASLATALLEMIPAVRGSIGEERAEWLRSLPDQYTHEAFTLVHASPGNLWRSPAANASDEELETTYSPLGARIVVYGHIHVPFVRKLKGMTVANSGSVSQSYDGDRRASYVVIEGENVSTRRVEYDVESEAKDLLESSLPHSEWLSHILLAGKYVPLE